MEHKIGEPFDYDGEWYQAVKRASRDLCKGCDFDSICNPFISEIIGGCDKVIFKRLDKVGEPFLRYGKLVQRYKVHVPIELPEEPFMYYNALNNTLDIEIKQMEESVMGGKNPVTCNPEESLQKGCSQYRIDINEHTASRFRELIDEVNKSLGVENGSFVVFFYMIMNRVKNIDNIKAADIVNFHKDFEALKTADDYLLFWEKINGNRDRNR